MDDATAGLDRLYECMAAIDTVNESTADDQATGVVTPKDTKKLETIEERFRKVMDDDFNTAQALGILFEAVKTINKVCGQLPARPSQADINLLTNSAALIRKLAGIMGLLKEDARTYLRQKQAGLLQGLDISEPEILRLIQERKDARAAKDWQRGDSIRDQLLAKGIELKDSADGTTWKIKGR